MGVFDTLPPNRKAGGRSVVITNFAHHCQSMNKETKEESKRLSSSPCRKPARWLLARRHEGWCTGGKNFTTATCRVCNCSKPIERNIWAKTGGMRGVRCIMAIDRWGKSFYSYLPLSIFSDDALLPGFRLKIPMLVVLDFLRSDEPHLRRVAETWMRCSLKSYLR